MLLRYCVYCFALILFSFSQLSARKIHSRQFSIRIPDAMIRINDTSAKDQGDLYLDTISGFVLIISDLDSKFRSVKDYLDCSDKEIEQQLIMYYGDSALQLISCNRSAYYPSQTTVLHFRVSSLPLNYDTYMMYFIHHRNEDIQIAFIYKKENETRYAYNYIDAIMKTLILK